MSLVWADMVMETSTTTGTGTLTLAGAVTGYQTFAAIGNGNACYVCIQAVDGSGNPTGDWEVNGPAAYTSSGTTLSRGTLVASSTGSRISFAAGTKRVFVVYPSTSITNLATTSGTNTGDQTITLTGNVTGSGTGSFAATIANSVVTEAKMSLADNTTFDVAITRHGFAPKLPNNSGYYLNGIGTYTAVTDVQLDTSNNINNDLSTSKHGFAPKAPNEAGSYLDGTAAWSSPNNAICQGRLTLATGTPVTTTDQSAKTTIYFTPFNGNKIGLYNGSAWIVRTFSEISLGLGTLTSGLPYDVFAYDSGGTVTLEFLAWTNGTTRATALATQDGIWCKTGALTRRYLGTFYTSSTTTTESTKLKRRLWNMYNRVAYELAVVDTTVSWNYTTAAFRQANGSSANQVDFVLGLAEDAVDATVLGIVSATSGQFTSAGVGLNSTTVNSAAIYGVGVAAGGGGLYPGHALYKGRPAAGYNYLAWLECGGGIGTVTWYGQYTSSNTQAGMVGSVWC